uniref:Uncharacterized protein n=1 Tax=Rhizophora mucronata TaxID=61149 RepID=A0A2P2P5A0_RHIMU
MGFLFPLFVVVSLIAESGL